MKQHTVLILCFLCALSCYCNDKLPQLEVKQRKGNMLVKLHNYNDTTSLVCVIQGSGNNLEADYDPEKVLKISGSLLSRGDATISIRTKETDEIIARCDTTINLGNAVLNLPEDSKGEIDPIPPISISPSDIKQLDFYRTNRQDPDIVVIQLKQNSAPQ